MKTLAKGPPRRARRTAIASAITVLTTGGAAAQVNAPGSGTITLQAAVIEVTSTAIVATGSPVLSSNQGTVRAPQFSVLMDKNGRAYRADATGGVSFQLNVVGSRYRNVSGTCDRASVYPGSRQADLSGRLSVNLTGPSLAPMHIGGSSARVWGNAAGKPSLIRINGARGTIASGP